MSGDPLAAPRIVLVAGHEAGGGADLDDYAAALTGAVVTGAGRQLHNVVTSILGVAGTRVVVVPMTFGRNPTMVADAAKTLRWLADGDGRGRVALAASFGTLDHLTAWLRKAANETVARSPGAAVVLAARRANPFDDAELHRVAHLVRTHGAGNEVEVSCTNTGAAVAGTLERLRLLGWDEAVIVPAGFARTYDAELSGALGGARFYGPLMSENAVLNVITDRVRAADHDLSHGRDGIAAGLEADHGHGYAHSHAFELDAATAGHAHPHPHAAPHARLTHDH
ncbi:hypothetical protein SAMN05216410_1265 [Sanguibacter gelidistatuariae]|uniref:Cobalamin biosynthesis protein CbiX n=1 Tax=Sanguibacter gelidistatuariae TaxID=1814289 RepID=A0A1G6J7M6_9MICO|nr:hypothetical protein [Sanguibacter gelidistatuariae]SDC14355.1 hypothetical protein SAMN05216410_1265 [Sanguibacter gelidistatuariae]